MIGVRVAVLDGLALNHPSPLRCDAGKYMIRDKVVMVGLVGFL